MKQSLDRAELLTPEQVAALLSVHPKTVTRWARTGRISFVRTPGGHRRYLRSDVSALIDARDVPEQSIVELSSAEPEVPAVIVTDADRAATAASVVATAAERARAGREHAADMAAQAVAREAVRTARRVQIRAQSAVAQVADAADVAARELTASVSPGDERQAAHVATLLAAITEAAARATAAETERAAATVARDVEAAAAHIARLVAAADQALALRVDEAADALEALGRESAEKPGDA